MIIIGMNHSTNANGVRFTTIHGAEDFNSYFSNVETGRGCVGKKVESIYLGDYDCSTLKVGMEIEILYDKAITTAKGTFQPINRVVILSK